MQSSQRIRRYRCYGSGSAAAFRPAPAPNIDSAVLGAHQVHEALCAPPVQTIGGFELASGIVPARYVSGDFVLSFEHENAWYVVLGDLMGKGLSAAMWLTHVVDLVRRATEFAKDLSRVMAALNLEMHRSRVGVPLTSLFLARVEPNNSNVEYACGGCPAAFLLRRDKQIEILSHGGPILGAIAGARYESGRVELSTGDTLMAVSDGIIERHHGDGIELRPDKVIAHLRDKAAGASARDIVKSLLRDVQSSLSSFTDDLSVMALKRVG